MRTFYSLLAAVVLLAVPANAAGVANDHVYEGVVYTPWVQMQPDRFAPSPQAAAAQLRAMHEFSEASVASLELELGEYLTSPSQYMDRTDSSHNCRPANVSDGTFYSKGGSTDDAGNIVIANDLVKEHGQERLVIACTIAGREIHWYYHDGWCYNIMLVARPRLTAWLPITVPTPTPQFGKNCGCSNSTGAWNTGGGATYSTTVTQIVVVEKPGSGTENPDTPVVTVPTVPLPTSLPLMLAALVPFGWFRRKQLQQMFLNCFA